MDLLTEFVGFAASVTAFVLFWPQAVLTWKKRNDIHALSGISVWGHVLLLMNAILWGVYALLTESLWVGAPGLVNGPLALVTIFLILKARAGKAVSTVDCEHCDSGVEHQVFVTTPPGFASVVECSVHTRPNGVIVFNDDDVMSLRSRFFAR